MPYLDSAQAKANKNARTGERRRMLESYKGRIGCQSCGESDPVVLDFHHFDPAVKEGTIAKMADRNLTIERLAIEVGKCVVVCSNCHRKISAGTLTLLARPLMPDFTLPERYSHEECIIIFQ
jgi:hypothetical protein